MFSFSVDEHQRPGEQDDPVALLGRVRRKGLSRNAQLLGRADASGNNNTLKL